MKTMVRTGCEIEQECEHEVALAEVDELRVAQVHRPYVAYLVRQGEQAVVQEQRRSAHCRNLD